MLRPALILTLVVAAALSGCGDRASIEQGGKVPGEILTVYTLAPRTPEGADLVRGVKLALSQAGGHVGKFTVQFASASEPQQTEGIAASVRDLVRDTGTVAVIGDLDPHTVAVSGPILNAVGLLQVSPLGPTTFSQPSGRRTFFALGATAAAEAEAIVRDARPPIAVEAEPGGAALAAAIRTRAGRTVPTAKARTVVYAGTDAVNARGVIEGVLKENRRATVVVPPALAGLATGARVRALTTSRALPPGFAGAFPGVSAGPLAGVGYDAMKAVLAALRRAGGRAPVRPAVIAAFRPPPALPLHLGTR